MNNKYIFDGKNLIDNLNNIIKTKIIMTKITLYLILYDILNKLDYTGVHVPETEVDNSQARLLAL